MSPSFLILVVLALCAATVGGATLAWMLDQGRRGVVPARRRRQVTAKTLPGDDTGTASS